MSESSEIFFMVSVLVPTLILLGLITARKLAQAVETATGKIPHNMKLFDHAPFEWALFASVCLLLCSAFTGAASYAVRDGNALIGAVTGIVAALIARMTVRLPIEHDDLATRLKALILPPLMSGALGVAFSQFYSPAAPIY